MQLINPLKTLTQRSQANMSAADAHVLSVGPLVSQLHFSSPSACVTNLTRTIFANSPTARLNGSRSSSKSALR